MEVDKLEEKRNCKRMRDNNEAQEREHIQLIKALQNQVNEAFQEARNEEDKKLSAEKEISVMLE